MQAANTIAFTPVGIKRAARPANPESMRRVVFQGFGRALTAQLRKLG
jgi:hypothetical protein